MQWFWKADRVELDPVVLVVEGSIPNEQIKKEGYRAAMGNREEGGGRDTQPMTTSEWLDRLAPKSWAVLAVGTCATYGGIHAMQGNPTGAMGVPLYPGGAGTTATIQIFTDYLTRLYRYVEFLKRCVPMHDDLFNFFYEALPGYEKVGQRRIVLGCWGSFQDPEACNFRYRDMTDWGNKMFVTPGVVVDGKYSWVMSPRWYDGKDHLALDTGGGPIARLWATALAGLVGSDKRPTNGYVKATGNSIVINLPKSATKGPVTFEWKVPKWSNAIERDRARTYFQAYACATACYFIEEAMKEVRAGNTKTWEPFKVPQDTIGCGFTEAVRGVLSHHMVIRGGKIANNHPYPPTPWNGNPRDVYGTPGPYEDAVQNAPIFEENPPEKFKGIDLMRAVRSFDPCLPCGVHMFLGRGRVVRKQHSPAAMNTI